MPISKITQEEINDTCVERNLANRPSSVSKYGQGSLSAEEVKKAYDRLPKKIAEHFNELVEAIDDGELDSTPVRVFHNLTASTYNIDSRFAEEGYRYKAEIGIEGVESDQYAEVTFSLKDAISGIFAPVCETYNGGIRIWSTTPSACVIETVSVWEVKGNDR